MAIVVYTSANAELVQLEAKLKPKRASSGGHLSVVMKNEGGRAIALLATPWILHWWWWGGGGGEGVLQRFTRKLVLMYSKLQWGKGSGGWLTIAMMDISYRAQVHVHLR